MSSTPAPGPGRPGQEPRRVGHPATIWNARVKQSRRNIRNATAKAEARKPAPPVSKYAAKQARLLAEAKAAKPDTLTE